MRSKSDSENSRRPITSGFKREATGSFLLRWLKIAERQYLINQINILRFWLEWKTPKYGETLKFVYIKDQPILVKSYQRFTTLNNYVIV